MTSPSEGATTRPPARRRALPWLLLLPAAVWLAVFCAVPLAGQLSTSMQRGDLVSGYRFAWSTDGYAEAFTTYLPHLLRSLGYGLAAAALCLAAAFPVALLLAFRLRHRPRLRGLLMVLLIAPFFTGFLIRTLAWKTVLADESPVVDVLRGLGLLGLGEALGLTAADRVLATPLAVLCGLVSSFLPFAVLPLYAALARIDPAVPAAARDLYASPAAAFRRVVLPLSRPGLAAAALLVFVPASGDYVNAALLGSPEEAMAGNAVQVRFLRDLDYPVAAALSFVLTAAVIVPALAYLRREERL